jgi:hypothetical protein|tara:strand:+ start:836 stop:1105 length:270 start_codon:yes stop_codon:yes gene_type:complete
MDKMLLKLGKMGGYKAKGKKSWEKRENFEDGSYKEIVVREVDNGFIKSVVHCYEKDDEWIHDKTETIHKDNPMEDKSLADKLETFLKDN